MAEVIAFFDAGRFNWIRKTLSECSVIMSVIVPLLRCRRVWSWFRCCRWTRAWFRCCRSRLGCGFPDSAAGAQAGDFSGAETEIFENLFVVLAEIRRAFRRHFADTMHLNRTADRGGQLAARAFKRNHDVIQPQLRIADDLLWTANRAERDVDAIKDLVPIGHRLSAEDFVENGRELGHVRHQLCRI